MAEIDADVFKALSDGNRLAILRMLSDGETCACRMLEELDISQPTLSHHMKILCGSGLVKARRSGQWSYYSIDRARLEELKSFLDSLRSLQVYTSTNIYIDSYRCNSMEGRSPDGEAEKFREDVREYYGKRLKGSSDLKTSACACSASPCGEAAGIIPLIDSEVLDRFYGCGSPIPPLLEGMTVLDLGCGTGRDAFIASKLVGPKGRVIGVDMTREQLGVAEAHVRSQTERFGFAEPNVEFRQGYIEDLRSAGIEDSSIDVVISNCVVNLCPRKDLVFAEIRRVLKDGGELFFSDVFADRRVPDKVYADPVLRGECLAGAMYVEDFRRAMAKAGFLDVRCTSESDVVIDDPEMRKLLGDVRFTSRTVRAFKLDDLEDGCEDYGQVVIYDGGIPGHPDWFDLDSGHRFYTNRPVPVCGNTASMCSGTRYGKHLHARGDRSRHFGRFEDQDDDPRGGCCCG